MKYFRWLLIVFTVASPQSVSANSPAPKAIAFVVGIENYEEKALNQLEYVAEDAKDVWLTIKDHTTFDEKRSRLLLSDRVSKRQTPIPTTPLTRELVQNELEDFLNNAQDGDLIILYLGGHGAIRDDDKNGRVEGVSFLPSDFRLNGFLRNISIQRILTDIANRLRSKIDVKVVVLANMCHAGAIGQGVMETPLSETEVRASVARIMKEHTVGAKNIAYIPAISGSEVTYETNNLKGSLFAHHLLAGIRGGASDVQGRVTSGSLFRYLQSTLPSPPPQVAGYPDDILIASTAKKEALYRLAAGKTLLASSLVSGKNNDLLFLASQHFEKASNLWARIRPEAKLLEAQSLILHGTTPEEALQVVEQGITDILPGVTSELANQNLRYLSQALKEEIESPAVYGLVITDLSSYRQSAATRDHNYWRELLSSRTSHVRTGALAFHELDLSSANYISNPSKTIMEKWTKELTGSSKRLLFIILDAPYRQNADETTAKALFSALSEPIKLWPGDVVIIFDSPTFKDLPDLLPIDIRDKTSLAFHPSEEIAPESRTRLLSKLLTNNPYDRSVDTEINWTGSPKPFRMRQLPEPTRVAEEQTLSYHWLIYEAAGVSISPANESVTPRLNQDILQAIDQLKSGDSESAQQTLSTANYHPEARSLLASISASRGQNADAIAHYEALSKQFQNSLAKSTLPGFQEDWISSATKWRRSRLEAIAKQIDYLRSSSSSNIYLVTAFSNRYDYPLIPPLPVSIETDINLWKKKMESIVGKRLFSIPVSQSATGKDIRKTLATAAAKASVGDLIIFIYSGRGYEAQDKRYLVTTDASLKVAEKVAEESGSWLSSLFTSLTGSALRLSPKPTTPQFSPESMVELSEIPKIIGDKKDLLVILDTQFTKPKKDSEISHIFDKYADTKGYLVTESSPPSNQSSIGIQEARGIKVYETPANLRSHVYIWWDGKVRQRWENGTDSLDKPLSTFSEILLSRLSKNPVGLTYRKWLESAMDASDGEGQLACQGAIHRPILAAGDQAETLANNINMHDRKEQTYLLALNLLSTEQRVYESPLDHLSHAAILFALGDLEKQKPFPFDSKVESLYKDGVFHLEASEQKLEKQKDTHLYRIYLILYSDTFSLRVGRPEEAWQTLYDAQDNYLNDTVLLEKLVETTRRAINQDTSSRVSKTRDIVRRSINKLSSIAATELEDKLKKLETNLLVERGPFKGIIINGQQAKDR